MNDELVPYREVCLPGLYDDSEAPRIEAANGTYVPAWLAAVTDGMRSRDMSEYSEDLAYMKKLVKLLPECATEMESVFRVGGIRSLYQYIDLVSR